MKNWQQRTRKGTLRHKRTLAIALNNILSFLRNQLRSFKDCTLTFFLLIDGLRIHPGRCQLHKGPWSQKGRNKRDTHNRAQPPLGTTCLLNVATRTKDAIVVLPCNYANNENWKIVPALKKTALNNLFLLHIHYLQCLINTITRELIQF